jgi:hypothetical protein
MSRFSARLVQITACDNGNKKVSGPCGKLTGVLGTINIVIRESVGGTSARTRGRRFCLGSLLPHFHDNSIAFAEPSPRYGLGVRNDRDASA